MFIQFPWEEVVRSIRSFLQLARPGGFPASASLQAGAGGPVQANCTNKQNVKDTLKNVKDI